MRRHQALARLGVGSVVGEQDGVEHGAVVAPRDLQKQAYGWPFHLQKGRWDWNDRRYVLPLSRPGTLAAAARRLNVNQTTVTRRLHSVQRALGARLFERVDGSVHPSKAAPRAIAHAAPVDG